ncbi:MAG: response regulator transcription factor [Eggerthellaceae bacterium]|nr:response regulator transcription factor [Eggerthellaceae bacterium]
MIYYVEDDTNIRDLTVYALRQAGFEASGFPGASDFFEACGTQIPELVLLDIMLPEVDGLEILKMLRDDQTTRQVPVIMLTAKGTEYDKVCGLDAGADDYLAKPFGMMELVSRINALLRRVGEGAPSEQKQLSCGDISISTATHTVYAGRKEVELTLKEFDLLYTLMRNTGQVFSRGQLLKEVWDMAYAGGTRTVDVHVQTLRQKLAAALPGTDAYIHTVRGVGYCMKLPQ